MGITKCPSPPPPPLAHLPLPPPPTLPPSPPPSPLNRGLSILSTPAFPVLCVKILIPIIVTATVTHSWSPAQGQQQWLYDRQGVQLSRGILRGSLELGAQHTIGGCKQGQVSCGFTGMYTYSTVEQGAYFVVLV
jgi:hypothetical protein